MTIGIDLGNTVTSKLLPFPHIIDGAFPVIKKLVNKFDETYIISRVNDQQRLRALKWIEETNFCAETGIKKENIYFCFERRDKAHFAKSLNINVFIDDRLDVLRYMEYYVLKIAFNSKDYQFLPELKPPNLNLVFCENWLDVEKVLL